MRLMATADGATTKTTTKTLAVVVVVVFVSEIKERKKKIQLKVYTVPSILSYIFVPKPTYLST
jgi:hypothetical protein